MSALNCWACLRPVLIEPPIFRGRPRHKFDLFCSNSTIFRGFSASSCNMKSPKTASATYNVMNIFDRQAKMLQRERAAQNEDFHHYEYIKVETGWRVADRIFDIKRTFNNAVELGCGRGYVSRHLTPDSVAHITLCDTSKTNLDKATVGEGVRYEKVIMDEELVDIAENSIDLVVSSLCLHWVNDLPGCFDRIMRCLKPDGVFMACVFGGDTLYELRQSLQLAETERLGGMFQRVSPFTRIRDIGGLLNSAGFTMQTVDSDEMRIWYPSAFHLMSDVRGSGEGNATLARSLRLNSELQFAAAAIYHEQYGAEFPGKGFAVPATYQVIHFLGWKPDPSQPQPLARGTGQVSLKDIHKIDEIVKDKKKIELSEEDMK